MRRSGRVAESLSLIEEALQVMAPVGAPEPGIRSLS